MYKYKMNIYPVETSDGLEWIARVPEINNCGGSGKTIEDAIRDVQENLEFELQLLKEEGKPIPQPKNNEYSGKLLLRLPKSLHEKIADRAEEEGVSINQFIISCLSEDIGQMRAAKEIAPYAFTKGCQSILTEVCNITNKQAQMILKNDEIFEKLKLVNSLQNQKTEEQKEVAIKLIASVEATKAIYAKGMRR